ncbi:MAG TPA: ROK family protein [Candidatus Enterococcus avicola]|uniref:ROK family protein n=1 Tax=Candidatus Enterococcus avicola TaxID=2838561 RepID=A0A9D2JH41_9ENTE|nr:ROK family protein [Candidatus Enterococcus avicola]
MKIGVIDIGGTSIKVGVFNEKQQVEHQYKIKTPTRLEEFYKIVTEATEKMKIHYGIVGVGISSPGSVNCKTGVIEGASAIPYIHNFDIVSELEKLFKLPVTIENDANCALLAEMKVGVAAGEKDIVMLVVGTGIGGAVVLNRQLRHGPHLLSGEFGYMLTDNKNTVSTNGTIVNAIKRYQKVKGNEEISEGYQLYEQAKKGDIIAKKEINKMLFTLAKLIFNIQYSLDPNCIVIGGGISQNRELPHDLDIEIEKIMMNVTIAKVRPDVRIAKFNASANLYGAAYNYLIKYGNKN